VLSTCLGCSWESACPRDFSRDLHGHMDQGSGSYGSFSAVAPPGSQVFPASWRGVGLGPPLRGGGGGKRICGVKLGAKAGPGGGAPRWKDGVRAAGEVSGDASGSHTDTALRGPWSSAVARRKASCAIARMRRSRLAAAR